MTFFTLGAMVYEEKIRNQHSKIYRMEAIRQFIEVKDHSFQVYLPEGFTARRVEVIILPSEIELDDELPQWQKDILDIRLADLNNPDKLEPIDELFKTLDAE